MVGKKILSVVMISIKSSYTGLNRTYHRTMNLKQTVDDPYFISLLHHTCGVDGDHLPSDLL